MVINTNAASVQFKGHYPLYPIILTTKKLFCKERQLEVFPTSYGPTYWGKNIVFFYYMDENGNQMNEKLSQQLNNFCFNYKLKCFQKDATK